MKETVFVPTDVPTPTLKYSIGGGAIHTREVYDSHCELVHDVTPTLAVADRST